MTGITAEMVANAAEILLKQGRKPTQDRVRVELGNTGSKTTIAKYLNQWKDDKLLNELPEAGDSNASTASAQPDSVSQAVNLVWENLHKETEHKIAEVQQEYSEKLNQAIQLRDEMLEELTTLREQWQSLQNELQGVNKQNNSLINNNNDLKQKLEQKILKIDHLQEINAAIINERQALIASMLDDKQQTIAELKEQLSRQKSTFTEQIEQQRTSWMLKMDKLTTENNKLKIMINNLENKIKQVNINCDNLQTSYTGLQTSCTELQASYDKLQQDKYQQEVKLLNNIKTSLKHSTDILATMEQKLQQKNSLLRYACSYNF